MMCMGKRRMKTVNFCINSLGIFTIRYRHILHRQGVKDRKHACLGLNMLINRSLPLNPKKGQTTIIFNLTLFIGTCMLKKYKRSYKNLI